MEQVVFKVLASRHFRDWLRKLRDKEGVLAIGRRLRRLTLGYFGDKRSVGDGVQELRFFSGPGYRIYFIQRGDSLVILLCGGDKKTQKADIIKAKLLLLEGGESYELGLD